MDDFYMDFIFMHIIIMLIYQKSKDSPPLWEKGTTIFPYFLTNVFCLAHTVQDSFSVSHYRIEIRMSAYLWGIDRENIHTFNNMLSYFSNAAMSEFSSHTRGLISKNKSNKFSVIYCLSAVCVCVCVERCRVVVSQWSSLWPQLCFYCPQPTSTYTCRRPLDSMAHNATGCIHVCSLTFLSPTYARRRTGCKAPLGFLLFLISSCQCAELTWLEGTHSLLLSYVFHMCFIMCWHSVSTLLGNCLALGYFCLYWPYVWRQ